MPLLGALIALRVPDPFGPLAHAEPHPLIAPEAVRPGLAVALASVGYAAVATFIVLHLEARGVGHGATVFAAFAAMIVLTRLVAGDLPDRIGAGAGGDRGDASARRCGLAAIAFAHSLPVALLGGMAMGAAFSLLNPSLMLIAVGRVSQRPAARRWAPSPPSSTPGSASARRWPGLAAALTGYEGAFVFAAAVAVASAAMILATLHRRPALAVGGRLALADEQRLQGAADPAALVEEDRLGGADATRLRQRHRVDADPLALRHPLQVDGEVDVDEEEAAVVEAALTPLPTSAATSDPLQRRRLLAARPAAGASAARAVAGPGSTKPPRTKRTSIAEW